MSSSSRRAVLVVFGVLIVGLLVTRQIDEVRSAGRAIGAYFDTEVEEVRIAEVSPGQPAHRAGLQAGDRILAIGGQPVDRIAAYDLAASRFERGEPVSFRVVRADREIAVAVTPGRPIVWVPNVVDALACLCYAALAMLAFVQAWKEPRGRLLTLLAAAIALELALPLSLAELPGYATAALAFYAVLVGVEIGLELHLASTIPDRHPWRSRLPWVVPGFYVLGVGVGLLYAVTVVEYYAGTHFLPWTMADADLLFWDVAMIFWAVVLMFLLGRAALYWPQPLGRQQAGLVLLGALPWAILLAVRVTLERLGGDVDWVGLVDPFVLLFYPVAIFAAIFRYHLFDLEMVVKRSMVFAVLTGGLVSVFYLGLLGVGATLAAWVPGSAGSRWALAGAFLLMGLLFNPLRQASQRLIERRFFPERRALRSHLVQLAGELPALGNVSSMGAELVARLADIFRVDSAVLFLAEGRSGLIVPVQAHGDAARVTDSLLLTQDDTGVALLRAAKRPLAADKLGAKSEPLRRKLEALGAALVAPLLRDGQLLGVIALGRKEFGEPFRGEEKELLGLLSHHVATVFENARLFESATRDGLTGLLRREAVLERLDRELQRAQRFDRPLTIGMADIDHFKEVNDRHGHLVGDLMLKRVAGVLTRAVRATDMVGRYGGEEFLIVLTETDLEGAITVADKMRRAVARIELPAGVSETARTTVSIGLASRTQLAAGEEDSAALIALADRALYSAKGAGRNRVDSFREAAGKR